MTPRVFSDPTALAIAAAESFRALALESVRARGRFVVALSGGSTPKIIYEHLAGLEDLPWVDTHVVWGDERLVPRDDARSNFLMAKTALLDRVPVPSEQIHRIHGEELPEAAVRDYAAQLAAILGTGGVFDLVHLGVGPDGHTASLFPATPDLESPEPVRQTWPTPGLEPQVARVTLSLRVLNAARVKQCFATGAGKREILGRIWGGEPLPAGRISDAEWWLDEAAQPPSA